VEDRELTVVAAAAAALVPLQRPELEALEHLTRLPDPLFTMAAAEGVEPRPVDWGAEVQALLLTQERELQELQTLEAAVDLVDSLTDRVATAAPALSSSAIELHN